MFSPQHHPPSPHEWFSLFFTDLIEEAWPPSFMINNDADPNINNDESKHI